MKKNILIAVMVVATSFTLMGCPKKPTVAPDAGAGNDGGVSSGALDSSAMGDSDSNNAMGIQTIHFPYDSFEIVGENKRILQGNTTILKDNPTVAIQIEGHCDERGGVQYNLALGEKRANAVKKMLEAGGVAGSRLTTISMGKEKPLQQGNNEEAWAQNRRANFVITSK